jgi:hypothetical protein
MAWSKKTKPTPANIRRRVSAAQDAINAAMDLAKARSIANGESLNQCKRLLMPLDNAHAWLVEAQRRLSK